MSHLKVDKIVNFNDDGPVEFSNGLTIAAGGVLDGAVNASVGFCTATKFVGSGIGLTGISGISKGLAMGIPFTTVNI
jgi:hypothetical protein